MSDEHIFKMTRWISSMVALVLLTGIAFGTHACENTDKKQTACVQAGRTPLECKELR